MRIKRIFLTMFVATLACSGGVFAADVQAEMITTHECTCETIPAASTSTQRKIFTGAEWVSSTMTPSNASCQSLCENYATSYNPDLTLISATYTTTATETQEFTPIVPRLGVEIPGLTFTLPTKIGEKISINYIGEYIAAMYKWLIGVAVVFAIVMIIVGGVQYMVSGGSKQGVTELRGRITNSLIGLVLLLGSYVILYTTNPKLTVFEPLVFQSIAQVMYEETIQGNLAQCSDVKGTVNPCTATTLKNPSGWNQTLTDLVNEVSLANKIDPILLATHLQKETGGNITYGGKRGPCGEIGPSQFMPTTYDAVVGAGGRCCTAIARKSGTSENDSAACGVTTSWPPSQTIIPNCNVSICGNCQVASNTCVDYFNTSNTDGLKHSVDAAAKLIARNLRHKRVGGDIALELCAYNGSGKQAAQYAQSAGNIYQQFCSNSQ